MAFPYSVSEQHRDFVLLIGTCLLPIFVTVCYVQLAPFQSPRRASISVDGMCCDLTAKPAIAELTRVNGVLAITPDYQQRIIQLELRNTRPTSPRAIWDAVANSSLQPIRLLVMDRTFHSRPVE